MVTQIGLTPTKAPIAASPSIIDQMVQVLPIIIVIALVFAGIYFLMKWFAGKKQSKEDLYKKDYKKTIEQCKLLKNNRFIKPMMGMPSWIMSKGVPVLVSYPSIIYTKDIANEESEKDMLIKVGHGETYKIGNYAGHCETTDGTMNLLIKSSKEKILFIFPKLFVVKVRLRHNQKVIDSADKEKKTKILPVPPDSITLSADMIILNTFGLEKIGEYYYLVNRDKEGFVVDTKPYIYNDMIEIATQKQVMDIGRTIASIAEDSMRSNPLVQFLRKTDNSLGSE
jgi:hypothetical protein